MNEKYVVNLRDVAIYHADNPFGSCSEKKLLQRGEMVLSEVNLSVAPGEFVYLIGRVGSGKSSLLKTLYAEMQLLTGKGYVAGFDLRRLRRKDIPYLRRRIGIVFQDYQLLTDRNVFMNLYYVMKATGWKREQEIRERIDRVLGLVELGSKSYKMPFELSGGQKRRVAIAGVMAMNPKVLILDEPASGLDPKGREQILGLIREYHEQMKNTVLLVSHSMEDIAKNVSKILVMNESKLFCYDDTVKVFHRSEELVSMGLAVPQITRVINRLKAMGIDIKDDVYTVGYAKKVILEMLEQKKNK